jgi:2-isopropylmalate synthase
LKKRQTYEIIDPKRVGLSGSQIILGKLSGRHAFSERVQKLGYRLGPEELNRAFDRFKKLADQKKYVFDEDIETILQDEITEIPEVWKLEYLKIALETGKPPEATLKLRQKKEVLEATSQGDGPVDACYKAIEKITKLKARLTQYAIQSVTSGKDALGEVSVKLQIEGKEVTGRGASTDIIEASVKAYLFAVNKVSAELLRPEPERSPV